MGLSFTTRGSRDHEHRSDDECQEANLCRDETKYADDDVEGHDPCQTRQEHRDAPGRFRHGSSRTAPIAKAMPSVALAASEPALVVARLLGPAPVGRHYCLRFGAPA